MATLFLRQYRLQGSIGVLPVEKEALQDIIIDVECTIDARRPAQTDCLQNTLDYASLKSCLCAVVKTRHYDLVETLAMRLLSQIHCQFQVQWVRVSVGKPEAFSDTMLAGVVVDSCDLKGDRDDSGIAISGRVAGAADTH